MNISHFFQLLLFLIVTALARHFKGHVKISAPTLCHKSHYSESHYQHSIMNGIGLAEILFFFTSVLWRKKIEHLSHAPQYSFFCYVVSIFLWYNYSFLYNFLPIHSRVSISVLDKWVFESLQALVLLHFRKNNYLEYFCQLPSKISMLDFFLSLLGSFSKICSEQLFCRESVCTCVFKKEFHSTHYLRNYPEC